jgi:hypothetical protein
MQGFDSVREGVQLEMLGQDSADPIKLLHFIDEDQQA